MASKYNTLDLSTSIPRMYSDLPNFTLKPVTKISDVLALATINDRALDADLGYKQWMAMFTERTDYSTTVDAVTEALTDPEYRLVKAVIPDPESDSGEKIVGFIHWFCGWIRLEQVDPFAEKPEPLKQKVTDVRDVASNVAEELALKAATLERTEHEDKDPVDRARRLKKGEKKYIETRNHYIAAIRGKRHMFIRRIMVLPEFQGKGVGTRLMRVVTDEADRLKIVCWLFARPIGVSMYHRFGYQSVGVTEMNDPEEGLDCAETLSMIRIAQPSPSYAQ